jgi:hypothetical protein
MFRTIFAAMLCTSVYSSSASAQTYSDELARCFVQSATAEEKAAWTKWTVSNLLLHPALRDLASPISNEKRKAISQDATKVFERLTLAACRKEAILVLKNEGERALTRSQLLFGGSAVDSLLVDPRVMAGLNESTAFMDMTKWNQLGKEAGLVSGQK